MLLPIKLLFIKQLRIYKCYYDIYIKIIITINVIWYNKYPNTKKQSISKLTEGEKAAHKRVAQILIDYIPHN